MEAVKMFTGTLDTPLGTLRIVGSDEGVTNVDYRACTPSPGDAPLCVREATHQLDLYFKGEQKTFSFKINAKGSEFQRNVWAILEKIEWGKTKSYLQIAEIIGNKKCCRAVANAIGKNPLLIVIPCHRVIASDGSLGGFSSGTDKKKYLLALEANLSLQ